MNKKALLDYALFARKELETQIALSLNKLGIYKDKILKANIVGDYTIIEGNPDSYPKRVYNLRKMMISEYFEGEEKFETVVEEFAYTWFNRLVAIRFMEVHDYFPHGFHVLTSRDGSYEPEILSNLPYVLSELSLEEDVVRSLRDQNKIEELYRYVLVKQCSALSKIIPDIFDVREPYLELLLPNNLLSQDSVIRKIELIPEEDFMNDVEVVGWLYQYYVQSNREEFRKAKVVTKELIPTLSQIFTPDWVVRYMADNSVGRLWLESYPDSSLKQSLKYYVEDAKQDEEVQKKLDEIKYKNVNPEEIKIIEPCCGSGHILVYVFDLLLNMYLEQGYNKRDIPALILKNNLYGLDVDKRAAQLAKFSLVMKARSVDNRFFNEDRFVNPRVFEIKDSQLLISSNYKDVMRSLHFSNESIKLAEYLVDTFEYGKVIGSLLKVAPKDYAPLVDDIKRCKDVESPGIFEQDFYDKGLKRLRYLIKVARVLARKYDVMITNPPYLATLRVEKYFQAYCVNNFPNSKDDLFAVFMEVDFVKKNGFRAIINPDSWMFIQSYADFRPQLLREQTFINMCHLGMGLLDATVHVTTFVTKQAKVKKYKSTFKKMVDDKTNYIDDFFGCEKYVLDCDLFNNISQSPFGYWLSEKMFQAFNRTTIGNYCVAKSGMVTGKDDYFVKYWYEVKYDDINLVPTSYANEKYVSYQKGGPFRRYYGNNFYVVNIADIYNPNIAGPSVRRGDPNYYFKKGLGWSQIGTNLKKSFRLIDYSCCGTATPTIYFDNDNELLYTLAFLNTIISEKMISFLNPTLNLLSTDICRMPITFDSIDDAVLNDTKLAIALLKEDWDLYETSWDFRNHKAIGQGKISDYVETFLRDVTLRKQVVHEIEERNNKYFLTLLGLEEEIDYEVDLNDVSIDIPSKSAIIKSLISYFVGCLMGRYSLEQEGLVYAGGYFDRNKFADYVDDDGILPIYQFIGINDGLTLSICKLVKCVYGDTYYRENLDFIANALGRKTEEGAEEAINRYLNDDFYKDHLKVYQNRPIYWMFSSGKVGAFKCLVYLHRYDKNTLAKINAKYFLPRTAMYKAEGERLADQLKRADLAQKKKIDNQLKQIEAAQEELQIYGQVLDHMANQFIDIDLDDGVKVNYVKFQGVSIVVNGATVKKDLLVPFGLEKQKK